MGKIDFTPAVVLMAMAIGVVFLKWMGTPAFKGILTQFNTLITQAFTQVQQVQAQPPAPVVTPPAPVTPPAEGITPATPSAVKPPEPIAPTGCDCTCMPMDGDATRRKIETAAGVDCVNHEYFGPENADALCATKLAEVCATRSGGGTSTTPATTPASGGGDEEEDSGGDEEEDEDEESANIARVYRVGGFR